MNAALANKSKGADVTLLLLDTDIEEIDVWSSVRARDVPGGTAPARVSQAIRRARTILKRRETEQ